MNVRRVRLAHGEQSGSKIARGWRPLGHPSQSKTFCVPAAFAAFSPLVAVEVLP
jgi:hypothetical protein